MRSRQDEALGVGVMERNHGSADVLLRAIVAGTASAVGEEFFRNLARHLAMALQTRVAFVAELVDGQANRCRLLGCWTGEGFSDNIEYDTEDTPCQHVVGKDIAHFPAGVQQMFPGDQWLKELDAESYLAIPLFARDATPIGHLGVVHDDRMDESVPAEPILRIFAARAASEMERMHADAGLGRSERHFRALAEQAPVAILSVDGSGRIAELNSRVETLFGYERDELTGKPVEMLLPQDARAAHRDHRAFFSRNPSGRPMASPMELTARRKDGTLIPVDIGLTYVETDEEHVFVAFISDASESRAALDTVRHSESRLSTLLSAIPDTIFVIGRDGTYLDAAPGERRDVAPPAQEHVGKNVRDTLPKKAADRMMQHIDRALQTNDLHRFDYYLQDGDGQRRFCEVRVVAIGQDRVVAIVRDTTDEQWARKDPEAEDDLEVRVEHQMGRRNPYALSFRELTVLDFLKGGASDKEIANDLGISVFTVNKHVSNILAKMDSPSRTEASIRALNEGLIE